MILKYIPRACQVILPVVFFLCGLTPRAFSGSAPTEAEHNDLVEQCSKGRYIEENATSTKDVEYPGYPGMPTKLYTYRCEDGQIVKAVLLYLSPEKAAKWISKAVIESTGADDPELATRFAAFIQGQSGFMIPLVGIVDEQEAGLYVFRDGIAVKLKNWPGKEGSRALAFQENLTKDQIQYAVDAPASEVLEPGFQARPTSISVEEYSKGLRIRDRTPWKPEDLRKIYVQYWNAEDNPLFTNFLKVYKDHNFPD